MSQKPANNSPLAMTPLFKVVGSIILLLLFVIGMTTGVSALRRSSHAVKLTGEVTAKQQLSPGGSSMATYSVSSGGASYNVHGAARNYQVGDTVDFWAAPGEIDGDFNRILPYDAIKGFIFAAFAVAAPILYWVHTKNTRKGLR